MTKHAREPDLFHQPVVPLPPRDRTHGLLVRTPRPCRRCGAEIAVIGPGKAMHAASLICAECETHRGWLSHESHRFITEIVNESGRPTEPMIVLGRQP
jgi:hypothetical protein